MTDVPSGRNALVNPQKPIRGVKMIARGQTRHIIHLSCGHNVSLYDRDVTHVLDLPIFAQGSNCEVYVKLDEVAGVLARAADPLFMRCPHCEDLPPEKPEELSAEDAYRKACFQIEGDE